MLIHSPAKYDENYTFQIPDTREGWVESIRLILNGYFKEEQIPELDYTEIRPYGEPIKTFGGVASGSEPLKTLHKAIHDTLNPLIGKPITETAIVDIMNHIGVCVVAGNVRRTAEIAFGNSEEFINLKNYELNPHRGAYGWTSNNSIFAEVGQDYTNVANITAKNGEPGYFWLENAQKYGRIADGVNWKDVKAKGANPCVIGTTEILTKKGYVQIQDVINQEIEVWNGFEWSLVTPKVTGYNQHIIKVTLSDGRELVSTDYHNWHLAEGYSGRNKKVQTKDLKIGDKIIKYNFPIIKEGLIIEPKHAYTQGFISAEGMDDYTYFWLYEPKYICKERLDVRLESKEFESVTMVKRKTIHYNGQYKPKDFVPFEWSLSSKIDWLSGLFDGDATELSEGGLQICSINSQFLSDLQKLLTTIGINSKICSGNEEGFRNLPNGKGGLKEYFCNTSYRLCIGAIQMQELKNVGLKCERLSFDKNPQRDASQFAKVVKIEDFGYANEVYCINEPLKHYVVFNGILTGNCNEQTLESYETCNLVETYPTNHENIEDYLKTLKYAYLLAKTVTLISTHDSDTNEVMLKNRRIGLSQSGIAQLIDSKGLNYYKKLCEEGYKTVQHYDDLYSGWFKIPKSIKTTSIKCLVA